MAKPDAPTPLILMADDDPDDRSLVAEAVEESGRDVALRCVEDGEELMAVLRGEALPDLVLLDLNMPRKDGRQALLEIKADAGLKRIPVVVLTTSNAPDDVLRCYERGANSVITKPSSFDELVALIDAICEYWLSLVQRPGAAART